MRSWAEHTAELELELGAGTLEGLFVEAALALGELLGERAESGDEAPAPAELAVAVDAPDAPALLAEWLAELAYRAERDGLVPARVERLALSETGLDATLAAVRLEVPHLVKAVTYHRLAIWRQGDAWRARVVLDV